MSDFFFTDATGKKQGPINAPQLKTLAERGIITPTTLLETDTGHKGTSGQLCRLFDVTPPQRELGTVSPEQSRNRQIALLAGIPVLLIIGGLCWAMVSSTPTGNRQEQAENVQAPVIPAQAGIQTNDVNPVSLAPRLRGGDAGQPQPSPVIQRPPVSQVPVQPLSIELTQQQIDAGWTPEKVAVVEQLRKDLNNRRLTPAIQEKVDNFYNADPILVGEHVVFSHNWIEYIGPSKQLSRQQFEVWKDKVDMLYKKYVELIGKTPVHGEKILINVRPFSNNSKVGGLASNSSNIFCFNSNDASSFRAELREIAIRGSTGMTIMHEMAHIFSSGNRWNVDYESTVDLIMSYAMETNPMLYYGRPPQNMSNFNKVAGNQHRHRFIQHAVDKFKNNRINAFGGGGDAYSFYTLGLVDKIGWDTYKQVFRSYDDPGFEPNIYANELRPARARDFFDRIEHFSGKPDVLRSLPDNGALLSRHFNAYVMQRNLVPLSREQHVVGQ